MIDWLESNATLLIALSAATFVGGLIVMPILLIRMREDYFLRRGLPKGSWRSRHPVIRWTVRIVRNVLGVILIVAGVAMLVAPGQGILTLLVGIGLTSLPGKRRLELYMIRRPVVLQSVNWIRSRAGRPPLQLPQASGSGK